MACQFAHHHLVARGDVLATVLLAGFLLLPVARAQASSVEASSDRADAVATSLVIINGFLVFFMQVGFLSFETGSGRAKNVRNILLKNLLDVMLAALVWWSVGYAFAYGKTAGGVIGTNLFFYEGDTDYDSIAKATRPWFFSWTFAIAACTIISGCLAERTALAAYPVATIVITGLVHPLLVHWIWNPTGWMGNVCQCQVLDFAGGMVVHMLGGLFGLVGAWRCGPRLGRFELLAAGDDDDVDIDVDGAAAMLDSASDLELRTGSGDALVLAQQQLPQQQQQHFAAWPPHMWAQAAPYPGNSADALSIQAAAGSSSMLELAGDPSQAHSGTLPATSPAAAPAAAAAGCSSSSTAMPGCSGGGGSSSGHVAWPGTAHLVASAGASSSAAAAAAGSDIALMPGLAQQQQHNHQQQQHHHLHANKDPAESTPGNSAAAAAAADCMSLDGVVGGAPHHHHLHHQQHQHQQHQQQQQQHHGGLSAAIKRQWRHTARRTASSSSSTAVDPRRPRKVAPRCGARQYSPKPMPGHDMAFVTLGTFMLWFGWFGFNNGSVYMYVSGSPTSAEGMANIVSAEVVQRTSMNTSLGGAAGGLTALLVAAIFSGTYDLRVCCNGVLSGLVTVTCMCGFVDPWAAVVCSGIAGAAYTGSSWLLLRCGIDDPLDSSAVHLGNGLLGTIMLAFVAKPEHVAALTGSPCGGLFYSSTGWLQLGLQLMGVMVVIVFAGGAALIMFSVLGHYRLLRVDQVTELAGIDNIDHNGPAYPEVMGSAGSQYCVSSPTGMSQAAQQTNPASAGRRLLQ